MKRLLIGLVCVGAFVVVQGRAWAGPACSQTNISGYAGALSEGQVVFLKNGSGAWLPEFDAVGGNVAGFKSAFGSTANFKIHYDGWNYAVSRYQTNQADLFPDYGPNAGLVLKPGWNYYYDDGAWRLCWIHTLTQYNSGSPSDCFYTVRYTIDLYGLYQVNQATWSDAADTDGDGYANGVDYAPNDPNVHSDPNDTDGDGIENAYDPYPDDPSEFSWVKIAEYRDSNGVLKATMIKTDRGDYFVLGDQEFAEECANGSGDCKTQLFINLGEGYPNGKSEYIAMFEGTDGAATAAAVPGSVANVVDGERQVTPAGGIESGTTSAAGDTDSQLLAKVVDNTAKIAANMQGLADRLKAIEQEARDIKTQAGIQGGTTAGTGSSTSAATIASGTGTALADQQADNDAAVSSATSSGISTLNGLSTDSFNQEPYTGSDASVAKYTDEDSVGGILGSLLSNNPLNAVLEGTTIELSGQQCSMNATLEWGSASKNVTLDLCGFEDEIYLLGTLLLGFVSLLSVLKVFE